MTEMSRASDELCMASHRGLIENVGVKCNCCPYGYHIETDFITYAERVSTGKSVTPTYHKVERQRSSSARVEQKHADDCEMKTNRANRDIFSPIDSVFSDSLEEIMTDFEDAYQRTTNTLKQLEVVNQSFSNGDHYATPSRRANQTYVNRTTRRDVESPLFTVLHKQKAFNNDYHQDQYFTRSNNASPLLQNSTTLSSQHRPATKFNRHASDGYQSDVPSRPSSLNVRPSSTTPLSQQSRHAMTQRTFSPMAQRTTSNISRVPAAAALLRSASRTNIHQTQSTPAVMPHSTTINRDVVYDRMSYAARPSELCAPPAPPRRADSIDKVKQLTSPTKWAPPVPPKPTPRSKSGEIYSRQSFDGYHSETDSTHYSNVAPAKPVPLPNDAKSEKRQQTMHRTRQMLASIGNDSTSTMLPVDAQSIPRHTDYPVVAPMCRLRSRSYQHIDSDLQQQPIAQLANNNEYLRNQYADWRADTCIKIGDEAKFQPPTVAGGVLRHYKSQSTNTDRTFGIEVGVEACFDAPIISSSAVVSMFDTTCETCKERASPEGKQSIGTNTIVDDMEKTVCFDCIKLQMEIEKASNKIYFAKQTATIDSGLIQLPSASTNTPRRRYADAESTANIVEPKAPTSHRTTNTDRSQMFAIATSTDLPATSSVACVTDTVGICDQSFNTDSVVVMNVDDFAIAVNHVDTQTQHEITGYRQAQIMQDAALVTELDLDAILQQLDEKLMKPTCHTRAINTERLQSRHKCINTNIVHRNDVESNTEPTADKVHALTLTDSVAFKDSIETRSFGTQPDTQATRNAFSNTDVEQKPMRACKASNTCIETQDQATHHEHFTLCQAHCQTDVEQQQKMTPDESDHGERAAEMRVTAELGIGDGDVYTTDACNKCILRASTEYSSVSVGEDIAMENRMESIVDENCHSPTSSDDEPSIRSVSDGDFDHLNDDCVVNEDANVRDPDEPLVEEPDDDDVIAFDEIIDNELSDDAVLRKATIIHTEPFMPIIEPQEDEINKSIIETEPDQQDQIIIDESEIDSRTITLSDTEVDIDRISTPDKAAQNDTAHATDDEDEQYCIDESVAQAPKMTTPINMKKPRVTRAFELSRAAAMKKLLTQEAVTTASTKQSRPFQRTNIQSKSLRLNTKKGDSLQYITDRSTATSSSATSKASVKSDGQKSINPTKASGLRSSITIKKEIVPGLKTTLARPATIPRPKVVKYAPPKPQHETPEEEEEGMDSIAPLRSEMKPSRPEQAWKPNKRKDTPPIGPAPVPQKDYDETSSSASSSDAENNEEGVYDARSETITHNLSAGIMASSSQTSINAEFEMSPPLKEALDIINAVITKSADVYSEDKKRWAAGYTQHEWMRTAAKKNSDAHCVDQLIDCLEEYGRPMLSHVLSIRDNNGNTALHYTVSHGNYSVVSCLLDSKVAPLNTMNNAGYTPVMLAALCQVDNDAVALMVVQRLFQMGNVNIRASPHGQTALMLAVSHGKLENAKLLVQAGAGVNMQDEDGSTALMCACEHGHQHIVRWMLDLTDIDATLADYDGSTALSIAVENGHRDIAILLYAHINHGQLSPSRKSATTTIADDLERILPTVTIVNASDTEADVDDNC